LPLVRGDPLNPRDEILSRNTRDNRLSYGENPKSLSRLVLDWYRVVTDRMDRRTERMTVANTRYSYSSSRA